MDLIDRDKVLEHFADYVASGYADSVEDFEEYSRIVAQEPTIQAVPIEKIKTLINVIEDFRKNPVVDNDDVDLFLYDVLFALNRLIEGSDKE